MTIEELERTAFESATYDYYLAKRGRLGQLPHDTDAPSTREQLFWRKPDGSYGVEHLQGGWWGWKTRALLTRVMGAAS